MALKVVPWAENKEGPPSDLQRPDNHKHTGDIFAQWYTSFPRKRERQYSRASVIHEKKISRKKRRRRIHQWATPSPGQEGNVKKGNQALLYPENGAGLQLRFLSCASQEWEKLGAGAECEQAVILSKSVWVIK
jgi:hypothetical protein